MIWVYLVFLFLFLNELGFIGYQTYLYNVMCMDFFLDGNGSEHYGNVAIIMLDFGTVTLDLAEIDIWWMTESLGYKFNDSIMYHGAKTEVIYHLNFTSQLYPSNDELLFQVLQRHIYTAPGDLTLVFFHMENLSNVSFSGVTIYTIAPFYLSYYVQKIQCFCFEELQIQGNQSLELPVIFFIDPSIENTNWYSLTIEYIFLFS